MKKLFLSVVLAFLSLYSANAQGDPREFDYVGVEYCAPYDAPDNGIYSLGWRTANSKGYGLELTVGGNWGLVSSNYDGMYFNIGPSYSYVITDKIMLNASLCFSGCYVGQGVRYERYETVSNGMKFFGGAALRPQVIFKFGNFIPHAGVGFQYIGSTRELFFGFCTGVGYKI